MYSSFQNIWPIMSLSAGDVNATMINSGTPIPILIDVTIPDSDVTKPHLLIPRPTVSLDARPILIPILSCMVSFPVVAFAVICALRYRASRLRRKDRRRRLKAGMRAVTLEIPGFRDGPSFFSRASSSDVNARLGDIESELPSATLYTRRMSRSNSHVRFMTTAAVLHVPRRPSQNGRVTHNSRSDLTPWEEPSCVDNDNIPDLNEELRDMLSR
ncbi:uncharacterized protein LOC143248778 isoform X1 [Tachypleus tridentatus]|uniref:uncharacterized protein LOC143248778 isoform X1 n=1 Tax=Tachypleus tridentatus TaxID=6853 RepID=UPI003FD416BB